MKRLITLAIMVAFILGTVGMAQAIQIQAKGDWQISTNYVKNPRLVDDFDDDKFQAVQRLRSAFEFVANENLKAVFRFHVENRWGEPGRGIGVSANQGGRDTIGYDLAYLDFMIPNTSINFKVGKQLVTLPGTVGSHIFDNFAYSVVGAASFHEMVGLAAGWSRLGDATQFGQDTTGDGFSDTRLKDEWDMFFAIVPVTMDGFQLNPFGAFVRAGRDVFAGQDTSQTTWFAGINATIDLLDPIVIMADFNYGSSGRLVRGTNIGETKGWIAALAVQYKMDMFTPMIYGLYESGESSTSGDGTSKGKRMPNLGQGDLYGISSFGFNGSNFRGQGRARLNSGNIFAGTPFAGIGDNEPWGASGKWGVGFKLLNIEFVENLSHEFQIAYYKGTNHRDSVGILTTRDYAWETNFNTTYQMYENLAAILELGYLDVNHDVVDLDAAWKAAFGLRYRF